VEDSARHALGFVPNHLYGHQVTSSELDLASFTGVPRQPLDMKAGRPDSAKIRCIARIPTDRYWTMTRCSWLIPMQ